MKNIYSKVLCGILISASLQSCDDYLDVNDDPNNPSSENVNPEIVLAATQVYTYGVLAGNVSEFNPNAVQDNMNQLGNLMMNNWTRDVGASNSSYYFNEHTYNVTSDFYSGIFENLYLRTSNYTFIQNTTKPGYENYKAIAKILKSFYFQYLVDLYLDGKLMSSTFSQKKITIPTNTDSISLPQIEKQSDYYVSGLNIKTIAMDTKTALKNYTNGKSKVNGSTKVSLALTKNENVAKNFVIF